MVKYQKVKIVMKKLYIQPSIEFDTIETTDILESSWNTNSDNSITGGNEGGAPSGELGGEGSGGFGEAKQGSFVWEDEEF